tara:strand:- start:514 stop:723 length:210 start_codon:yes stop_codon:yes gene_type:complete
MKAALLTLCNTAEVTLLFVLFFVFFPFVASKLTLNERVGPLERHFPIRQAVNGGLWLVGFEIKDIDNKF